MTAPTFAGTVGTVGTEIGAALSWREERPRFYKISEKTILDLD
jgi:hypothetical protein